MRGFCFIDGGDDYLLASYSETGNIHVLCVKERLNIYRNERIPNGVQNMIYNERVNSLFIISRNKHEFFEIPLKLTDDFFEHFNDLLDSDLQHNIQRRFLRQNDKEV